MRQKSVKMIVIQCYANCAKNLKQVFFPTAFKMLSLRFLHKLWRLFTF